MSQITTTTSSDTPLIPSPEAEMQMRPYQLRILDRINPLRSHIELKYGSGKSWIALEYARRRMRGPDSGRFGMGPIILCEPRNILTWRREIARHYDAVEILTNKEGLQWLMEHHPTDTPQATVLLFSYYYVNKHLAELVGVCRRWTPAAIIADESTRLKNPDAQWTEALHRLTNQISPWTERLTLTGRTAPEGPKNFWAQFQFVYGKNNPLGATYYAFLRRWFIKTDYDYVLRLDTEQAFWNLVHRHAIYFDEVDYQEYLELLGSRKVRYTMELYEESAEQRRLLKHLYENWALPVTPDEELYAQKCEEMRPNLISAYPDYEYNNTLSITHKAQQISSGFYYTEEGNTVYLRSCPKMTALAQVLEVLLREKPDRQIILWYALRGEKKLLEDMLTKEKISYVVGPDAAALMDFATAAQKPTAILMPVKVSKGFNELAAADTTIFVSNVPNQELRDQAEARNTQARQQHELVQIIDLCSTGLFDIDMVTSLQAKNLTPDRLRTLVNQYLKPPQARHEGTIEL